MSTNVDLSKVKIHPQKRKNGIQVYCTWCFDDGTKNGIKERMSGYGKTEAMAKNKLKENIQKKQDEYTYGAAIEFGDVTVKEALQDFLKREKNGEYISKKTGKPKTLIAVEHDYETANSSRHFGLKWDTVTEILWIIFDDSCNIRTAFL